MSEVAADSGPALPKGSRCARHPDSLALALCVRCGSFACYECLASVAGAVCCTACVPKLRAEVPRERLSRRAIALGCVGVVVWPIALLVLGRAAFDVLLAIEMRKAAREHLPLLVLGAVGAVWPLAVVLFWR